MKKLRDYLHANEISQAAFGLKVGLDQGTISKLCTGPYRPSLKAARRIEVATNGAVPMSVWVDEVQE